MIVLTYYQDVKPRTQKKAQKVEGSPKHLDRSDPERAADASRIIHSGVDTLREADLLVRKNIKRPCTYALNLERTRQDDNTESPA
jgi:hypothetical protein